MKTTSLCFLTFGTGLCCLAASSLFAQAPRPPADAPKPPVHKPEQSVLNRLKQDDRSKKELSDAIEKLREAAKRNESADKEIKRIDAKDLKDNPGKVIESIKDKLSPEDNAELKAAMEKAKEAMNSEEVKKALEDAKKKAAATIKPKSASGPYEKLAPPPVSFDRVPAPAAAVVGPFELKARVPNSVVTGEKMIFPFSNDPANPDKPIAPSDPRGRTYVVIGNGQVKTPTIALDADRIECIKSPGSGDDGLGNFSGPPKPKGKTKSIDPVQAGAGAPADEPFERIIANGRVNLAKIDNGELVTGKGGSFIYDKKSGRAILSDWPQVQKGNSVWTGIRKDATITIVPKGQPSTEGCTFKVLEGEKVGGDAPKPLAPVPPKAKPVPE
jgi:lipopolysaccharide export system protein LptA